MNVVVEECNRILPVGDGSRRERSSVRVWKKEIRKKKAVRKIRIVIRIVRKEIKKIKYIKKATEANTEIRKPETGKNTKRISGFPRMNGEKRGKGCAGVLYFWSGLRLFSWHLG